MGAGREGTRHFHPPPPSLGFWRTFKLKKRKICYQILIRIKTISKVFFSPEYFRRRTKMTLNGVNKSLYANNWLPPSPNLWRYPCECPLSKYCLLDAHNSSTSLQCGILTLKMCHFILAYPLHNQRKKAHESPHISLHLLRFLFYILPSQPQSSYSVHKKGSRNNELTIALPQVRGIGSSLWGCKGLQQSRPALGSTQPPIKWVPGALSRG
jgi:hypothetical protein